MERSTQREAGVPRVARIHVLPLLLVPHGDALGQLLRREVEIPIPLGGVVVFQSLEGEVSPEKQRTNERASAWDALFAWDQKFSSTYFFTSEKFSTSRRGKLLPL